MQASAENENRKESGSTMKWDNLTGNLIDTQPGFSVMQTLDSQHTDDATRAFAAHKLR